MALSGYERLAFRLFGARAQRAARTHGHLRISLLRAQILLRPEVYWSFAFLNTLVAFICGALIVAAALTLHAFGKVTFTTNVLVLLVPIPALLALTVYFLTIILPDVKASNRASEIDRRLPYALNYVSTMSSAGVNLDKTLESLSRQVVYGEVAVEASLIVRDVRLLGRDLTTALQEAIDRSPSTRFQDILQGALSTLLSGADLAGYFRAKSEQYLVENRQEQRRTMETLGVLSEAFVTIVVATPILLMIILSVLNIIGNSGGNALTLGYMMILILLPVAQGGFAYVIRVLSPDR